MATYIYALSTAQLEAGRAAAIALRLTLPVEITDTAWHVPLGARPGGKALLDQCQSGDAVVAFPPALGPSMKAMLEVTTAWQQAGVSLYAPGYAELGSLTAPGGDGARVLAALHGLDDFRRTSHTQAIKEGIRRSKATGRRTQKNAPIGYSWVQRDGAWVKEPDPYELDIIQRIQSWRERGLSWSQIARHLLLHKIKTSNGLDWDTRRCQKGVALLEAGELPNVPAPPE